MAEQRRSKASKRTGAAKPRSKQTAGRGGQSTKRSGTGGRSKAEGDVSAKDAAELREALTQRFIDPLGLVMLTRERIEEAVDDAVTRGRVTADDAQDLVTGLIERGRKQTNDVLGDLEQLLERGRGELGDGVARARKRGGEAARRARKQADPVIAHADKARRAAGIGANFPIPDYDELTVAQVQAQLTDLTPAELRKVRDHERRHANRKTVLSAIAERLK